MKHLKLYENFGGPESIDISDDNELNVNDMTLTVRYAEDGWDDTSKFIQDLTYLANNQNDSMSEEIDDALSEYGLQIDPETTHDLEINGANGWVTFSLMPMEETATGEDIDW